MKTKTLLSLVTLLSFFADSARSAPLGTAFTYQGKLTDGSVPANGNYDFRFAVYDAANGGGLVVGPVTNTAVGVATGLFTTTLDFGMGVFTGDACWLEIGVRTNGGGLFATFPARQPLTPTPYALYAPNAGGATLASTAATATSVAANGVANASLQNNAITTDKIADGTIAAVDVNAAAFNTTFWRAAGNSGTTPGTHFLGTTDNQPVEIKANNSRVLRLEPDPVNDAPNVIAGSRSNTVAPGVVGAVIAGGGRAIQPNRALGDWSVIGGGEVNVVSNHYDVVSGGTGNTAGGGFSTVGGGSGNTAYNVVLGRATVAGGMDNRAHGQGATVGGGRDNAATHNYATVPGGRNNLAGGEDSFAAGRRAKALHSGAFVWADSTDADFASTGLNQFLIRASGGVGINTTNPMEKLQVDLGNALVRGPNNFAPGTSATLFLGDDANYFRAVWGQGLRFGVFEGADALSVANGGKVGIGIGSPEQALHVVGDAKLQGTNFTASGHTARLILGDENHILRSVYAGGLRFGVWPYPDALVVQDGSGNVGIGTASPQSKLEVQGGPIKATGGLIIETRTSDPPSPVTGQLWLRTDL